METEQNADLFPLVASAPRVHVGIAQGDMICVLLISRDIVSSARNGDLCSLAFDVFRLMVSAVPTLPLPSSSHTSSLACRTENSNFYLRAF